MFSFTFAVVTFQSLGLRRDDVFTSSLLEKVIQKFSAIDPPLSDGEAMPDDTLPPPQNFSYKIKGLLNCATDWPI